MFWEWRNHLALAAGYSTSLTICFTTIWWQSIPPTLIPCYWITRFCNRTWDVVNWLTSMLCLEFELRSIESTVIMSMSVFEHKQNYDDSLSKFYHEISVPADKVTFHVLPRITKFYMSSIVNFCNTVRIYQHIQFTNSPLTCVLALHVLHVCTKTLWYYQKIFTKMSYMECQHKGSEWH